MEFSLQVIYIKGVTWDQYLWKVGEGTRNGQRVRSSCDAFVIGALAKPQSKLLQHCPRVGQDMQPFPFPHGSFMVCVTLCRETAAQETAEGAQSWKLPAHKTLRTRTHAQVRYGGVSGWHVGVSAIDSSSPEALHWIWGPFNSTVPFMAKPVFCSSERFFSLPCCFSFHCVFVSLTFSSYLSSPPFLTRY